MLKLQLLAHECGVPPLCTSGVGSSLPSSQLALFLRELIAADLFGWGLMALLPGD